jgi:hypothetical protein
VFSFLSSELQHVYEWGTVAALGRRVRAGGRGKQNRRMVTLSANFTGTDNLCLFNPRSSSSPEAAKSLVARMVIDSYSEATHTSSSR